MGYVVVNLKFNSIQFNSGEYPSGWATSMPRPDAHFLNAADWNDFSESMVKAVKNPNRHITWLSSAAITLVVVLSTRRARHSQPLIRSTTARQQTRRPHPSS